MRKITHLVVHCSATQAKQDIGAKEIRGWHVKDRKWRDIGYHYVVRRDGTVEKGRDEKVAGAHVAGHNTSTIGICWVGGVDAKLKPEDNRTTAQKATLVKLLKELKAKYPKALIWGHRDFPGVAKACPSFDARAEYSTLTVK